jgi:hypothetical protein
MSIIDRAKIELRAIGFDDSGSMTMLRILEMFFDEWDSGGAVYVAAPILQRLIAGKPLSPLTGDDGEWIEVGTGVWQNKRLSSVFKDIRFHDGKLAFDLDNPNGRRAPITFPYFPEEAVVRSPVVEFEV